MTRSPHPTPVAVADGAPSADKATSHQMAPGANAGSPDRQWRVSVEGFPLDVYTYTAKSAKAAKYAAFKALREAGYFDDRHGGFRRFLERVEFVQEVRRYG
jgi:hypothetical protein